MLNKIVIMGRLTRDPELRRTNSGTAVTSFSIACDRDFKSQSGEKETDFAAFYEHYLNEWTSDYLVEFESGTAQTVWKRWYEFEERSKGS